MTLCTTKTIEITRCKKRKVQANFNGGEITSDAGVFLLKLAAYLRPSSIDPAYGAWSILKLLSDRLRQVWPKVKIIFRADSGF